MEKAFQIHLFACVQTLYIDNELKHEESVSSVEPFSLPAGYVGRELQFEVAGNSTVKQVNVATSIEEIYQSNRY